MSQSDLKQLEKQRRRRQRREDLRRNRWIPASVSEYMRVSPTTSTQHLTTMLLLSTNWSILENLVTNRRFENFTDYDLPAELIEAAGLGSEFSPSTDFSHTHAGFEQNWMRFTRSMRLRDFFFFNPPESPPDGPAWARIPNPHFEPTTTVGLSETHPKPRL